MLVKNCLPHPVIFICCLLRLFSKKNEGRGHLIHTIVTSLSYSKVTFYYSTLYKPALLNPILTFHKTKEKFLATCAIQNISKTRKDQNGYSRVHRFDRGKVSLNHCSPSTITYYGRTREGLCQQVTYGLKQLVQSTEGTTQSP